MRSKKWRIDLVDRYNASVGKPGPLAEVLQHQFIAGKMDPALVDHYIKQCEDIIASRTPLKRRDMA